MSAATQAAMAVAVVAMVSALCGALLARVFWAEDLRHAQRLSGIWLQHRAALEQTIAIQKDELEILRRRKTP